MTTPTDTATRVLPVHIPTVPHKGPRDTDAQLLRMVAGRIESGQICGHNVKTTAALVLRNAADALDATGEPDPESSYWKPSTRKPSPITFEWTNHVGEVQGNLVYVLYGEPSDPRPLYVGKTTDVPARLVAHRSGPRRKEWFEHIRRVVLTQCPDDAAAVRRERQLIHDLDPVFNIQRYEVS